MRDERKIDGLVVQIQSGDTDAFGDLYEIFLDEIYRFVYYKVTHKELAEDLTEDAFFRAWKNIHQYQKTTVPFSSWLYRITLNTIIDYFRRERIHLEEIKEEIHDDRMDTRAGAEEFCNQQLLQKALIELPESQREAIILKYVNELTYSEISAILQKSETAVRILVSRALSKLKDIMAKIQPHNDL